ncbi:MAG: 1-deoxy-D-xylulose-5-phosphate synthase [Kofleriaceae bacterium]|nr:hypothetical protein [Myxococcales bacterium]MCB9572164.1 1-deoxy-D-xylulose-5-phosphate synthase [Kofleriaceae bacterium]
MSAIQTRIMYIQRGTGPGRIGRVRRSKTGRTLFYRDLELIAIGGASRANHLDVATGEAYWVSGPRKDGQDTLYPGLVEIDDDVVVAYWRDVRGQPDVRDRSFRSTGVHGRRATR